MNGWLLVTLTAHDIVFAIDGKRYYMPIYDVSNVCWNFYRQDLYIMKNIFENVENIVIFNKCWSVNEVYIQYIVYIFF